MMTGTFTVIPSPRIEELLKGTLAGIAADIGALKLPGLRAVVLGGGYGRGEGGVLHTEQGDALYNDLDFFVFASGAGRALRARIDRALRELSRPWTEKLGVAVDFGPVKNCSAVFPRFPCGGTSRPPGENASASRTGLRRFSETSRQYGSQVRAKKER